MAMPAMDLLEASGFTLSLVGKPHVGELFEGTLRRFDPIEGNLLDDIRRVKELAAMSKDPQGLLLPNSFGSAMLFKCAGIKSTGVAADGRTFLLEHALPEPGRNQHEVKRFWQIAQSALKKWGVKPAYDQIPKGINMKLAQRNAAGARNLINKLGLPEKFAILSPIAKGRHEGKEKYWKHFNELVKPLKDRGVTPIVFPAKSEIEMTKYACPDAVIYDPISLGNFASLCSRAAIVIANDSGVSHIAAAVKAPQVTIVGVTDIGKTSPWSDTNVIVGNKGRWPTVPEVVQAIDKVLKTAKG